MINYPNISNATIARIARNCVSFEQKYYYKCHGWNNHCCIIVTYPNGYGACIEFSTEDEDEICWDVTLLKDGKVTEEVWSDLEKEKVFEICDNIFSL